MSLWDADGSQGPGGGAEAWGTRKGSGIFSEPLKLISFSSHVMFEARKNVSVREQFSFFLLPKQNSLTRGTKGKD